MGKIPHEVTSTFSMYETFVQLCAEAFSCAYQNCCKRTELYACLVVSVGFVTTDKWSTKYKKSEFYTFSNHMATPMMFLLTGKGLMFSFFNYVERLWEVKKEFNLG
jgi:hypothetical protein